MAIRYLEVECGKCKVARYCPRIGSSPARHGGLPIKCKLLNGYGRTPVAESDLSEESRRLAASQGPCLTLAEVPTLDEEGRLSFELTKIFSPPVLHERETVQWPLNLIYPKSHS